MGRLNYTCDVACFGPSRAGHDISDEESHRRRYLDDMIALRREIAAALWPPVSHKTVVFESVSFQIGVFGV